MMVIKASVLLRLDSPHLHWDLMIIVMIRYMKMMTMIMMTMIMIQPTLLTLGFDDDDDDYDHDDDWAYLTITIIALIITIADAFYIDDEGSGGNYDGKEGQKFTSEKSKCFKHDGLIRNPDDNMDGFVVTPS